MNVNANQPQQAFKYFKVYLKQLCNLTNSLLKVITNK